MMKKVMMMMMMMMMMMEGEVMALLGVVEVVNLQVTQISALLQDVEEMRENHSRELHVHQRLALGESY